MKLSGIAKMTRRSFRDSLSLLLAVAQPIAFVLVFRLVPADAAMSPAASLLVAASVYVRLRLASPTDPSPGGTLVRPSEGTAERIHA
jgi:hypothetical protein